MTYRLRCKRRQRFANTPNIPKRRLWPMASWMDTLRRCWTGYLAFGGPGPCYRDPYLIAKRLLLNSAYDGPYLKLEDLGRGYTPPTHMLNIDFSHCGVEQPGSSPAS